METNTKHTVEAALLALSSVDQDYASVENGVGFSGRDTGFGNSLAKQVAAGRDLSPKQYGTAYRMLKTYKVQLGRDWGIDYDQIERPEQREEKNPAPDKVEPTLDFVGGIFSFQFPYDPALKDELKDAIPGRRWDGDNKVWTAPAESAALAGKFALKFGFKVTTAALKAIEDSTPQEAKALPSEAWAASWATDAELDVELGKELLPFQRAGVRYSIDQMEDGKGILIGDEMGLGKLLADSEPVLTPGGWRRMDALKVGDEVIGSNGEPTAITGVFPQGEQTIVKVTFSDGSWSRASWDHLWAVQHVRNGWRHPEEWKVMETRAIASTLRDGAGNLSWRIPMVNPIPIFGWARTWLLDPYFLGLLLGDGSFRGNTPSFSSADEYLVKEVEARLPFGTTVQHKSKYDYRLVGSGRPRANPLTQILRQLDLMDLGSHSKFVPDIYLYGNKNDRLALLRGLMDTDGTAGADGMNEYSTVSPYLADAVEFLVQSLGGTARRAVKKNGAYRVYVKLTECPFLLPRKADAWVSPTKYPPARIISNIEEDGTESARCIRVAAEDGLFVTRSFIVTHNTPQSAAILKIKEGYPALIAMPRVVWLKWAKELMEWTPGLKVVLLGGRIVTPKTKRIAERFDAEIVKLGESLPEADVYLIKYSVLHKWVKPKSRKVKNSNHQKTYWATGALKDVRIDAVVWDEVHFLKEERSQRTQAALGITGTAKPKVRLGLSGTAMPNRHQELLSVLKLLGRLKDVAKNEWDYLNFFCNPNGYGLKGNFGFEWNGSLNGRELNHRMRSKFYSQHEKLDRVIEGVEVPGVQPDLPALIFDRVPADLTDEARYEVVAAALDDKKAEYSEAMRRLDRASTEEQRSKLRGYCKKLENEVGVLTNEARKVVGEEKIAFDIEWIENWLASSTSKMIVFGWHREVNEAIANHFNAPIIYGGTTEAERQDAEDRFNDDPECRLLVGQIASAGVGWNGTAADTITFVEFSYVWSEMIQAIGRAYGRLSDPHGVNVNYLYAPDTIDEHQLDDILPQKEEVHVGSVGGA